jgi:hypothetical protein
MKNKKDADGNDLLDENGNPIPEENMNANGDESISKEEADELKKALANTVEELKVLRKKNQELTEKPPVVTPPNPDDEATKIAKVVKQILTDEKMSNAKTNKQVAFEKFITENKEFHPDNDPTGLKRQALETKLSRFNTDDIIDMGEYYDVIKEAQLLLTKNDSSSNTSKDIPNPYSSSSQSRVAPQKVVISELNPKEEALVKRGSATKEQILKMRVEKPAFLASLLERVHDY